MDLKRVLKELPDTFTYKNKKYKCEMYGRELFPTKKYPTRSKEIIYNSVDNTNQIYIYEDTIEEFSLVD